MHTLWKSFILWFGLLLTSLGLMAQSDTIKVSCAVDTLSWRPAFEVWVDTSGRMGLEEAREASGYVPIEQASLPLPLGQQIWARTWLVNQCEQEVDLLFTPDQSDSAVVYMLGEEGMQTGQFGNNVPGASSEEVFLFTNGIRLSLAPGQQYQLYVLKSEKFGKGPDLNPSVEPYWKAITRGFERIFPVVVILSIFAGILLISILYNLIVAVSLRSASYLFYALYLLAIMLIVYYVLADQFIPSLSSLANPGREFMKSLGTNLSVLFYLLFGRYFVNAPLLTPKWDRWLKFLIGVRILLVGASLIIALILPNRAGVGFFLNAWLPVELVFMLLYVIKLIRLKSTVLWFFIIGSFLVFFLGFGPVVVGIFFDGYGNDGPLLMLAICLEILVFSLGLGYKVRQQQQAKLAAEQALNQELQKVNSAFGRFVPHAFIESLGHQSVLDVKLGDQVEKEVTVLFSDIRGYTSLAEGMTPQENFDFLNSYLGRMGPIIQAHDGFVNQYYGDGIMALFLNQPGDALQAATRMQQELTRYNQDRQGKGRMPLKIGIGIHTGPLMMGIIGDTLRLEAGVVSDTVNTAARMEGLTKHFGVNALLSESTFAPLSQSDKKPVRRLGKVQVKGRQQPSEIFQAFGGEADTLQASLLSQLELFEAALQAYLQQDFAAAIRQWEQLTEALPDDAPTRYYLNLSRKYLLEGVEEDWDGTERMLVK